MNDMELAEEIERRRGGTDMLNSVLMRHQWDQIIAALRRGPDVAFEAEKNFLHGKLAEKLERACSKRRPSGEMVIVPKLETEAMQDSVRGILQAIRCNPGVTEDQVYQHCKLRGDSTKGLHENDGSYVTEARAAAMIYRAMIAAAEAEVRKPCPLCGRTDPHSHTSGPPGMS